MRLTFGFVLRSATLLLLIMAALSLAKWAYQGLNGRYSRLAIQHQQTQIQLKEYKREALTGEIARLETLLTNLRNNNPETIENLLRFELGYTRHGETKIQLEPSS